MELHVTGKLQAATAKQPSFTGFCIEAVFDQKPALTPCQPSTYSKITALSDDAGNFTLALPDQQEIASKTVKFLVWSPAGRTVGVTEVQVVDLLSRVSIEVEGLDASTTPGEPAPLLNTPQSVAVDALFRSDAALRRAITENLKPLRGESEAVAARVEKAWNFRPSRLSTEELARRHYVAPGSDPSEALHAVIMSGVDALRSARTERTLTLRNSAELKKLIKTQEGDGSLREVVELGQLVEFIQRRGAGPIQGIELTSTPYAAEAEAEAILGAIGGKQDSPVAHQQALISDPLEVGALVKDKVNIQMNSATAPESEVSYAKLPNSDDEDKAQKTILETFELRKGPTDVPSYHDFHTLQIAFQHVWTEIFDGQLASLGRDLYDEYVKLKDFSGSTQPDLQVSTIADLRRLIEEIKKLSQFTQEEIPSSLRPEGGAGQKTNDWNPVTPENAARLGGALASGGLTLLIEAAIRSHDELRRIPRIQWTNFPGPLPGNNDVITMRIEENVAPAGYVQIHLEWKDNSLWKGIAYQELDVGIDRIINIARISNNIRDGDLWNPNSPHMLTLAAERVSKGLLEFDSQLVEGGVRVEGPSGKRGRYLLDNLDKELRERRRVTFNWEVG